MKIIDLLNKIAKGEEVPKKIKYETIIWNKANSKDYTNENDKSKYLFDNYMCYCEETLNDEIEIIEEVEDKEYEDIEEIGNLLYIENQVESILHRKIDALIRNQKYILERLDK